MTRFEGLLGFVVGFWAGRGNRGLRAVTFRNWLTRITLLVGIAALPNWANALPVYAYSKNEISFFSIETATVSSEAFPLYDSSHTASFAGFGTSSHPQGAESGTNNLVQSTVGPGGFAAEDYFAPHGKTASGYARADTGRDLDVIENGLNSSNVAEAYRTTPGTASANAITKLTAQITTKVPGEEVNFTFFSDPFMRVMTSADGDEAVAELALSLSVLFLSDSDGMPAQTIFTWSPCGNASDASCFDLKDPRISVSGVRDPFDLNQTIECSGGACERTWPTNGSPRAHPYFITLNIPDTGFLLATISAKEDVRVRGVPEPSTILLVATSLALLRWRTCRMF